MNFRGIECTILATIIPIGLAELVPEFLRRYCAHPDLESLHPDWTPAARVGRALRAGISARRVVLGLFPTQAISAALPFENQVYICLRDCRTDEGWWTTRYNIYWGNIADPNTDEDRFFPGSVSHAFPSFVEVEVFLRGALRQWPPEQLD